MRNKGNLLIILMMAFGFLNLAITTLTALSALPIAGGIIPNQEGLTEAGKFVGMALSTGLAAIGAGYAVGHAGSAAIASITEKPEMFGRAIIIVGLAEGIAIYGLLISFLIWIS